MSAQLTAAPRSHDLRARWRPAHVFLTRKVKAAALSASHAARPVLANLLSIPLTVAGIGCIDAACFAGNLIAGLAVTGVSLIVLEHLIADEGQ